MQALGTELRHPGVTIEHVFRQVRVTTCNLCLPLEPEDYTVQSMPDASPTKWHLAHTSWFFEQFLLEDHLPGYRPFRRAFGFLFNSYYQSVGPMHRRAERGLLTRPTIAEVMQYRTHVDEHMQALLRIRRGDAEIEALVTLGLNHEQQHQELILTDLKHLFSCNPLLPAYCSRRREDATPMPGPMRFHPFDGGVRDIGAGPEGFAFDNERPRHRVYVEPFALADRPVTNGEYREFVQDGGYRRAELWQSDGWATVNAANWSRPLYWTEELDAEFTLSGLQALDPAAPVNHLSWYEADAFARWSGARLPTEAEWEVAAAVLPVAGNFLESGRLHPAPPSDARGFTQMFGDVWEWTASAYSPYPGYHPPAGALGEYNGKFMCNQFVLRGGSCATPAGHARASYRNFFYPQARWQFSGVRLARDLPGNRS